MKKFSRLVAGGLLAGLATFSTSAQAATIAEALAADPRFSNFTGALNAAGLLDMLNRPGPFTVFAPTDDAFLELGSAAVTRLQSPEGRYELLQLLDNHIVFILYPSDEFDSSLEYVTSGQLDELAATGWTERLYVDGAQVIEADILLDNGIIHVIEDVLVP